MSEVDGRDRADVLTFAWCAAELWAAGRYDEAAACFDDMLRILAGRDFVDRDDAGLDLEHEP